MFSRVLALLAVLLLSANASAAIEINNHQARNMDDVQSLGVIYINHNFATESEARQALRDRCARRNVLPRDSDAGTGEQRQHARQRGYLSLAPGITNETLP